MYYKKILRLIIVLMVITGIYGCNHLNSGDSLQKNSLETSVQSTISANVETVQSVEIVQSVENTLSTPSINDSTTVQDWKKAYIDYLKNNLKKDIYNGYKLININNDDIPELIAIGSSEALGNLVCVYHDGNINTAQLSRLNFTYIEKENLLCNSDGHIDSYYDIVYSIKDGILTKIASGDYGSENNTKIQVDENGFPIYVYKWNNIRVLKDEYYQQLTAVYNSSKAISGTNDYNSYETIVNVIQNY